MSFRSSRPGFTLIELLVVIAIIGLLAAVLIATLGAARMKARDAQRLSNVTELTKSLELYYAAFNSYPMTLAQLVPDYIPVLPTDPDGSSYYYEPYTAVGAAGISPRTRCGAGKTCVNYHLAADLEDASNPALGNDQDVSGDTIKGQDDSKDCNGAMTGRHCYDVMP